MQRFFAALFVALSAALMAVPSAVRAQAESSPAWVGIWRGTLGRYPVTVCLQQDGAGDYFGAYYYDKRLRIITLHNDQEKHDSNRLQFVESEAMPKKAAKGAKAANAASSASKAGAAKETFAKWELQTPTGDSLQGSFGSANDPTLPIALHRTGAATETCSGAVFSGPIQLTYKVVADKPGGTAPYVGATLDFGKQTDYQVTGFQLNATDAVSAKINLALMKRLREEGDAALDCRNNMLDSSGYMGDYSSTTEPALLTQHWLVARTTESDDCGGAHPNASLHFVTWDRTQGKEVDPWTWLARSAVKRTPTDVGSGVTYTENEVLPALQKLLAKHWPRDDADCNDAITIASDWHVHPGPHSLIFTPDLPHVIFACTEDDEIPYGEILPLLNATGREAVRAIQAEPDALEKKW